ncbi:hypothetical protein N7451_006068 [Penicillium sp. IBT 35674x]|nr:hypothetical protein N7451_006068 [Penicillium sp. IBT 35674x]
MDSSPVRKMPLLPPEIWHQILIPLSWANITSLKMVALTNRRLHEIAASILYGTFHMPVYETGESWSWDRVSTFPWRYVKVIVVTGTAVLSTGTWVKYGLLKMIEAATGLQEF